MTRTFSHPGGDMPALTGIRLPLALWVVTHHLSGPGRMLDPLTSSSATLYTVVDSAWLALPVFFAISGFVLTRRYRTIEWSRTAVGRYAAVRFARIYPLYAVSLLVLLPIIYEAMRQDGSGGGPGAGVLLNYVLLLQGWHRPAVDWNTPAWSLSCEVFFYACLPLIVRLVRVPSWWRAAAVTVVACGVPILLRLTIEPPIPKALLYFGDFLIGVAVATVYDLLLGRGTAMGRLGPWTYGPALCAGGWLLLARDAVGPFIVFDTGMRLVSALIVFGMACGGGSLARALSSRLVVAGGQASYAIYILHVPLLWWFKRWKLDTISGGSVTAAIIYIGLVVVISVVVSRAIADPASRLVRDGLGGRRPSAVPRFARAAFSPE